MGALQLFLRDGRGSPGRNNSSVEVEGKLEGRFFGGLDGVADVLTDEGADHCRRHAGVPGLD